MKKLIILIFCLALTACGFHLRGNFLIPAQIHVLSIQSNSPYDPLIKQLQQQLQQAQVKLMPADKAPFILQVNDIQFHSLAASTTQSLSLQTQTLLVLSAQVSLTTQKGKVLSPSQLVSAKQNFALNQSKIQSTIASEAQLKQNLTKQLAQLILNRISSGQTIKRLNQM